MGIDFFGTLATVYEGGPMLITAEQNFLISQSLSKEGHRAVFIFQKTENRSSWLRLQLWFISSIQFSHSIVSDSLRPHELQHSRPPCPCQLPEFTQTHVHRVGDTIQPSHILSSPSPPALNLSQHQGLFKWVSSLHLFLTVLQISHKSRSYDFHHFYWNQ